MQRPLSVPFPVNARLSRPLESHAQDELDDSAGLYLPGRVNRIDRVSFELSSPYGFPAPIYLYR